MRTTRRRTLLGRGRHDGGASAVEYALILAGVAILSIGAIFALGRTAKTAFTNATSVVSTQPAGVLPVVPETTTAAPGPTTTSPAPTTTSPAPTPTTTSPTPSASPTPPRGATTVPRDRSVTVDVGIGNNDRTVGNPTLSPDVGSVSWDRNDNIVFTADRNAPLGPVVITYSYQNNGRGPVITETITIWITA